MRKRPGSNVAFAVVEDFTDRYTNIAIAGMNYVMFTGFSPQDPVQINTHVYSCLLIDNSLTQRWRGRYNEDTDLCLQVLSAGYCTVLVNAFCIMKIGTMVLKGGNTDDLYKGDGRLRMANSLKEHWPYIVETKRRFNRPQHFVRGNWAAFDTPLQRRTDLDWDAIQNGGPNNYGMYVKQVADTIRTPALQNLINETKPRQVRQQS